MYIKKQDLPALSSRSISPRGIHRSNLRSFAWKGHYAINNLTPCFCHVSILVINELTAQWNNVFIWSEFLQPANPFLATAAAAAALLHFSSETPPVFVEFSFAGKPGAATSHGQNE